jgi:hypothetical protein
MPPRERGEVAWKWTLRALGVAGYVALYVIESTGTDLPWALYILNGGLLGAGNFVRFGRSA